MKVTKEGSNFNPITVVIETKKELEIIEKSLIRGYEQLDHEEYDFIEDLLNELDN